MANSRTNLPTPLTASVKDTQIMLGNCSDQHVYNLLDRGELQGFKDSDNPRSKRYILIASIERYIERHLAREAQHRKQRAAEVEQPTVT